MSVSHADVDAWLDGDLDPVRAAEVARAVDQDPTLAAIADRHRAIRLRLRALPAPAGRDLRAAVLARIGAPRPRVGLRVEWLGLAVAAGAVLWIAWPAPPAPSTASSPAALRLVSPPVAPPVPPLPEVHEARVPRPAAPLASVPSEPHATPPLPLPVAEEVPPADVVLTWALPDAADAWMAHRLAGRAGGHVPVPLGAGDLDDGAASLVVEVPADALSDLVTDLQALGTVVRAGTDGLLRDGLVRVRIDVTVQTDGR